MTAPETREALKPCPFCGEQLGEPTRTQFPRTGLAMMHPGTVDDGSCPIAGWGFYEEQLEHWNTRATTAREQRLREALENLANAASATRGFASPMFLKDARAALSDAGGE